MANPPSDGSQFQQQINNLNFDQIIGAPMEAAVKAQARSAVVTCQWLDTLTGGAISKASSMLGVAGLESSSQGVPSVPLSVNTKGSSTGSMTQNSSLELDINVPLLSLVPVPYLRIDSLSVNFNCQLNNTGNNTNTDTDTKSLTAGGSTGGLLAELLSPITMNGTYSDQDVQSGNDTITEQYTMNVTMNCVQDAIPQGMATILNIFASLVQQAAAGQIQAQLAQIQQAGQQKTLQ